MCTIFNRKKVDTSKPVYGYKVVIRHLDGAGITSPLYSYIWKIGINAAIQHARYPAQSTFHCFVDKNDALKYFYRTRSMYSGYIDREVRLIRVKCLTDIRLGTSDGLGLGGFIPQVCAKSVSWSGRYIK